jgi:hypothetical protein
MKCKEQITELVECARRGSQPGRELRAHFAACASCRERWDAERQLSDQFQTLRISAAAAMAQDRQREALMRSFVMAHPAVLPRRSTFQSWGVGLAMAAALVASVYIGHVAGTRTSRKPAIAVRGYPRGYEPSEDASALSSDDFIAIPYTPPLAQGELIRVVHADLRPQALASMGIDVDPVWAGDVAADVVEGEDGIPRAVRITDNTQN